MKSLFDAFKILWLNVIETKSDWNRHKDTVSLRNLFLYLIQEYVPIGTDYDSEVSDRLNGLVQLV